MVEESGKLKGKSLNAKIAATLFVASKIESKPKQIKGIDLH
jgi:hypothetical protein